MPERQAHKALSSLFVMYFSEGWPVSEFIFWSIEQIAIRSSVMLRFIIIQTWLELLLRMQYSKYMPMPLNSIDAASISSDAMAVARIIASAMLPSGYPSPCLSISLEVFKNPVS